MTELTVTESSGSAAVAADDNAPLEVVNNSLVVPVADGRKLTLTYPGPLAQYKIVRAMGPTESENARLCRMYMPLIYLSAIDNEQVFLPTSLLQIEALIDRLGHKGLSALQKGVGIFDARDEEEAQAAKK